MKSTRHYVGRPTTMLLSLAALALVAAPAFAQGTPDREERSYVEQRLETLLTGITLTSAQKTSIDAVMTKYATMLASLTADSPPDSTTKAALTKQDAEIRAVLTPEQQAVWDRNLAALKKKSSSLDGS